MTVRRTAGKDSFADPTAVSVSDAELVERLAGGDADALDVVYERYSRAAYSLARRVVGDDNFAQDVVQDVFLALWKEPGRFVPGRGTFGSWLLAMTHHKAVDAVRREESLRRRRDRVTAEFLVEQNSQELTHPVDERAWSKVVGQKVRAALHELPDAQRIALALAYFGGYSQSEVAALTDTPLGTVKTRTLAGMRRLRDLLGGAVSAEGLL